MDDDFFLSMETLYMFSKINDFIKEMYNCALIAQNKFHYFQVLYVNQE